MFGVLLFIDFRCVGNITQRCCLAVFFIDQAWGWRSSLSQCGHGKASRSLHHEYTAVGLRHGQDPFRSGESSGSIEYRQKAGGDWPQLQAAGEVTPRQLLHLPKPRKRGSGLPSPVLKFAWQRMQTYIFELDIMGLTPGSALGRAALYSACVWRSLGASGSGAAVGRLMVMAVLVNGREWATRKASIVL